MTPVWFKCIVHHICCWQHLHVLSPIAAKWYRAIVNLNSCVVALPQRDEEIYHRWGAWRDAAPAHLEGPSEVAQHLYQMSPGCLPQEVFWSWEETMGKVRDTLEWYCMSLGSPGNALGSCRKSRRNCPGNGKSECPCSDCCPLTMSRMDGKEGKNKLKLDVVKRKNLNYYIIY